MTGVGEQPYCHTNATTSGRQNQVLFSGCVSASETSQSIYLTSIISPYPCAEERRGRGLLALAATPCPRVVKREGRGLVSRCLVLRSFFVTVHCFCFFVVLYLERGCFPVILFLFFHFAVFVLCCLTGFHCITLLCRCYFGGAVASLFLVSVLRDTSEDNHQLSASVWFEKICDNHGGQADNNSKYSLLM